MLLGSINHVALTVADLRAAMRFLAPFLRFLGYEPEGAGDGVGTTVVVCVSPRTGTAINVWQARGEGAARSFERWSPGLQHLAFNVERRGQVDDVRRLVESLGAHVTDGPGEFPYAEGGYYAVYFEGPDGIRFEVVHMPELERLHRERGLVGASLYPATERKGVA